MNTAAELVCPQATPVVLMNFSVKLQYRQEGQEVTDTFRIQAPTSAAALTKALKRLNNDLPKEVKIKIKSV